MFRVPRGFAGDNPRVYDEMMQWAEDGLIPSFTNDASADQVVAQMLKAVRKHINEKD